MYSIDEANTEIKGCCEAAETGARTSFPGVTQPAPSAPPAPLPIYLHTQKARRGPHSALLLPIAPRRSPQVAARRGVSVGGQSPRLARTPGAQHGRVLPCRHRSYGRTGSQHFRSPRRNLRAATPEGSPSRRDQGLTTALG